MDACAFEAPCQLGAKLVKEFTARATAACGTRGVKGNLWQNLVLDDIVQRLVRIYPSHFRRAHVPFRLANGANSELHAEGVNIATPQLRKEGHVPVLPSKARIIP